MKKFVAIFCALLLAMSVTACKNNEDESQTESESSRRQQYESDSEAGDESESKDESESEESDSGSESGSESQTGNDNETETEKTYTDADFKSVNEVVYITAEWLSLRAAPKSDAKIEKYVAFGQNFKRVGYNEVWSIVESEGVKYYAYSEYLTTTNFTGSDFTVLEEEKTMYVNVDSVYVRLYPSTEKYATIITTLTKDTEVTCVGTNEKWCRIKLEDHLYYISASCLSEKQQSDNEDPFGISEFNIYEQPITMYVIASSLNVRQYPSADNNVSSIKGNYEKDQTVICLGDNGTWVQINYNGNKYYVKGEFLGRVIGGDPLFGGNAENPDVSDFDFYDTPVTMYVTAATLYIRQLPSDDNKTSAIKGTLSKDQAVTCYGDNGTWVQIDWNGYKYYVGMNFLSKTLGGDPVEGPDLSDFTFFEAPVIMYVKTPMLNIRLLPDSNSAIVSTLLQNEAVICTGYNDYWYQISIGDNLYYVGKTFITATKPQ